MDPGIIKRLDEVVVNRIAAGEIIRRPANALKEMIENSLDAKSTLVQIIVKSGGLKYLQIQDNGTGIRKSDLEIICERFTTSKLESFEDLSKISTYGFRGEALSSISHVAHLTIQTKTGHEKCAFRAIYEDGKLEGSVKPCAGNQGTLITVEDLFYNVPQRKNALKSTNEEFQKISDVVSKYAVHNNRVGFSLKKMGENFSLRTQMNSTHKENIGVIYGNDIAKELVDITQNDQQYGYKMTAHLTNVNYSSKKSIFLLFINHRLVESVGLKAAISQIYSLYLPKGSHPFVYMSLEIEPKNVDVNVHPTKHEVHFLYEEEITEKIKEIVEKSLLGSNETRTFYTQTRLPGASEPLSSSTQNDTSIGDRTYAKDLVRTDSKEQKLEKFFINTSLSQVQNEGPYNVPSTKTINSIGSPTVNTSFRSRKFNVLRKQTKLTSILRMRKGIEQNCNSFFKDIFNNLIFVGCVSRSQALIQHETKLYLCDTKKMSEEIFYQILLYDFENFGKIKMDPPLSIRKIALLALNTEESGWTPEDGPIDELADTVRDILIQKSQILNEYYNMKITDDGMLHSLPILLEHHTPSMCHLPIYILRLATEVDWEVETEFFQSFHHETARFYSEISTATDNEWKWYIEHILYRAIKQYLLPPQRFMQNKSFLQIANLSNLYKVFERC